MQKKRSPQDKHQRIFRVGLVGASEKEADAINRIFAVTRYRCRHYVGATVPPRAFHVNLNVDFLVMFSLNPNVVQAWQESEYRRQTQRPLVYLTREPQERLGHYQLQSPINPSRLIHLLDQYTIRELNYFPEFEIGGDERLDENTMAGLRLLRQSAGGELTEQGKRILVVDDSLSVRRQLHIELAMRQAKVDLVETAEQALQAVEKQRYDMIFLDVVLPGMDGYSACKKVKKHPHGVNTPIILLTSKSSSFDKIKGALSGCDAYLVKPVNHNEFDDVYRKFNSNELTRGHAHAS